MCNVHEQKSYLKKNLAYQLIPTEPSPMNIKQELIFRT
mgnify:CR=1 FL=1